MKEVINLLTEYSNIIKFINEVKSNLSNNNYKSGQNLERDFYKSISLVWEELVDLKTSDLTNIYEVQKFLINNVYDIHKSENNMKNRKVLSENINIIKANKELIDGKRSNNIYSLNEKDWEYYIVGDIHSDTISLDRILEKTNFFNHICNKEKVRLVFLGDYVDRGKAHLKGLQYILTLKYLFPENVFLLKGNHDGGSFIDGEVKMWVRKPEKDNYDDWFLYYLHELSSVNESLPEDIIHNCLKFFHSLANIAFISAGDKIILGTHGGIPRPRGEKGSFYSYIESISDLTDENIKDNIDRTIVQNMIWSDPTEENEDLREDSGRFRFTESHFEEFRNLIGFDLFLRGHQVEEMGYKKFFNDRLITIFSSGTILSHGENINNETAYEQVDPKIIHIDINGKLDIIDLN